ncbi:MAG: hypothetical protein ACREEM_21460 [Blastocatellia bacterium]
MKFYLNTTFALLILALFALFIAVDRWRWPSEGISPSEVALAAAPAGLVQTQPGEPELPRVRLDTTYVPPTGRTIAVAAGGDFQAALNQAQPGDVITLQAGATYTGNFTLPRKTGNAWIVIRSSAPDSSLPPPGTRITPALASVMPKLLTPSLEVGVITADAGAHHYRFIGIEFGVAPGVATVNLVVFGDNENTLTNVPHNLIIDRCYLHGTRDKNARRGIALNSASSAVIDSYLSDFHETFADSQAIASWNSPGPLKIVNNYLEGSGENILFGGTDPRISGLVPSDIEIRRNHCFKPLSWKADDPSFAGIRWLVKNLLELKNAQRVLIEGNLLENNWVHGQNGFAILFTVRNQDGTAPWSVVQDVTFTNNIVRHTGSGINISGTDDLQPSQRTKRIKIRNNLFDDVDGPRWSGAGGNLLQLIAGPGDVRFEHNTAFQSNQVAVLDVPPPGTGFVFRDNLMPHNEYGVFGSGKGTGKSALDFYFSDYIFMKNVLVGGRSQDYPADNSFPETLGQVGFVDRAGGDYRLAGSSPFKNAGSDGRDIGCDFNTLVAVLNGATTLTSVSAASYSGAALAPESITSAFGSGLSTATLSSTTLPLPTVLGGTSVRVRDRTGTERLSPLFFVSPTQANYLIARETMAGAATVSVMNGDQLIATGPVQIENVAPGLFTADASGRGLPAATVLRAKADGTQQYEPIGRFDAAQNRFVAVPIDLGPSTDQVYLILFATGLRFNSSLSAVSARTGGLDAQVLFAGAQGGFSGLDQVNLLLPRSLAGRGDVDLALTVAGKSANTVQFNVK